jgi:hypothetical protein
VDECGGGVLPNEVSVATLVMEISLGSSEQWRLKCSLRWTPSKQ